MKLETRLERGSRLCRGWAVFDSSTDGLESSVCLRTALSGSLSPSGASGWPRPGRG